MMVLLVLLNLFHVIECPLSSNICTAVWVSSRHLAAGAGVGVWRAPGPAWQPPGVRHEAAVPTYMTYSRHTGWGPSGLTADSVPALSSAVNSALGTWVKILLLQFLHVLRTFVCLNCLISNLDST